jgi:hypothetical protein
LTFVDVKIFMKGSNRWITMPSKEFTNELGEKKYIEMMRWDSEAIKNRFRTQIMEAIDAFLLENPDMKPEDVIKPDEELPF